MLLLGVRPLVDDADGCARREARRRYCSVGLLGVLLPMLLLLVVLLLLLAAAGPPPVCWGWGCGESKRMWMDVFDATATCPPLLEFESISFFTNKHNHASLFSFSMIQPQPLLLPPTKDSAMPCHHMVPRCPIASCKSNLLLQQ